MAGVHVQPVRHGWIRPDYPLKWCLTNAEMFLKLFSIVVFTLKDVGNSTLRFWSKLWLAKWNAAKFFVSEKSLFFEIQLEWLNLHVLEACLPEKHAFIVCKAFKTIHILKSLCTSINISSHTCDMLSSEPQCAVANIFKRGIETCEISSNRWSPLLCTFWHIEILLYYKANWWWRSKLISLCLHYSACGYKQYRQKTLIIEPRQANLCLRAFRHDKL